MIIFSLKLMSVSTIDSLEVALKKASGQEKIEILIKLSKAYLKVNPDISYDCAAQAFELAKKRQYKKGTADALYRMGHYYRFTHDYSEATQNFEDALNIYRKLRLDNEIALIYNNLGSINILKGSYSEALDYYTRSLGMFIALENEVKESLSYNNIGIIYYRLGLYDESLKNFFASLKLREKLDDPLLHSTLNNLGNIYFRLRDYDKALEMYERSLSEKRRQNFDIQITLNNIGQIYVALEDYDRALQYFSEALRINEENNDEKRIAVSLNNIAVVYEGLEKYDEALSNYQKALEIKQKFQDKYGYANTSKNLVDIFLRKKDFKQADFYLEESLETAKSIKSPDLLGEIYELLSNRYAMVNDYKKAFEYQSLSVSIRDSIFNEETNYNINKSRTNYKVEKTLREKEILEKNNQIYKLELEKDKAFRLSLFLLVLILVMTAIFLIYNNFKKKKINDLLEQTNVKLEEKVALRTAELVKTNKDLKNEIEVRKETGKKLRALLAEKNIMLREIHHRVKNNLQIIASILNMQRRNATNKETLNMFKNTHDRVMSISLVQEQLYLSDDLALVDMNQYVRSLIINIFSSNQISHARIKPLINIQNIYMNVNNAIPCGLLINEIVTNAICHGFKQNKSGEITINMKEDKKNYFHLEISDNSDGLPLDVDYKDPETVGMELIRIFILQLSAEVKLVNNNGVVYKIKFKKLKN